MKKTRVNLRLNLYLSFNYFYFIPMKITYQVLYILIFCFLFSCYNAKYKQGEELYLKYCVNCHQVDGKGLAQLYPPISSADYWLNNQSSIPCIIKHGLKDTIQVNQVQYSSEMIGIKNLTENDICNIINFINYKWYPQFKETTISQVKSQLDNCN